MAEGATKLTVKNEKTEPATAGEWDSFESLRRQIENLFEDFGRGTNLWRPFGRSLIDFRPEWPEGAGWAQAPAVDVVEKDAEYEITAELPGLDASNVEVKLANGLLTIKGEKKQDKEEKKKDYYLSERRYGSFQRTFRVPEGVDEEKIAADFRNGVLAIKLPKLPEAQQQEKMIAIQTK